MKFKRFIHETKRFQRKIIMSTKIVLSIWFLVLAFIVFHRKDNKVRYRIILNSEERIFPIHSKPFDHRDIDMVAFTNTEKSNFLSKVGHLCTRKENSSNLAFIKYSQLEQTSVSIVIEEMKNDIWLFCAMANGFAHGVMSKQVTFVHNGFWSTVIRGTNHAIVYHDEKSNIRTVHAGFLMLGHTKSGRRVSRRFLFSLLEYWDTFHNDSTLEFNYNTWKGIKLHQLIIDEFVKNPSIWNIHNLHCVGLQLDYFYNIDAFDGKCSRLLNSPCCQMEYDSGVVMLIRDALESLHYKTVPFYDSIRTTISTSIKPEWNGPEPCNNCVRWTRMFDFMADNDCLPSYPCHVCLTKQSYELDFPSQCEKCEFECRCYCKILCHMRPERNRSAKEYLVQIPRFRISSFRLIPRIIHQTYFKELEKDTYPNFSRLVSSWKHSGWEYRFYDNDASAKFLETHFPPEVKEAYEILAPGAYKADLFRYCVLLIYGGIYADVDVLLNMDLNKIDGDIGFMVPVDEPGRAEGTGSCLWNGFIAAAPGHPFIAKVVEMVVNVVRNRFTSVDIDDMLCPNPNLGHSHDWDLLFITGPCLLGAAINVILGKSMQSSIEPGELKTMSHDILIPGRTIILAQNKTDVGSCHRFNWEDKNLIVATTDMPNYEDNVQKSKHYSASTREMKGIFGLKNVYKDMNSANEDFILKIKL
jgi:hypothetical protein